VLADGSVSASKLAQQPQATMFANPGASQSIPHFATTRVRFASVSGATGVAADPAAGTITIQTPGAYLITSPALSVLRLSS
jgi:hypothetical protein